MHLCDFPVCDESYLNAALEKSMDDVLAVVALGRAARNAGAVKNRQPLAEMIVVSERAIALSPELEGVVLDELNVKKLTYAQDENALIGYTLKPQLKTLGPKYGKRLKEITAYLQECDAAALVKAVKNGGTYAILGGEVVLSEEDLQIFTQPRAGYAAAAEGGITVALDTDLTEELLDEGCERELVSKIQTMRKEAGFEVTDRIEVYYKAQGRSERVLKNGSLADDVLAQSVQEGDGAGYAKTYNINGDEVTLTVTKVEKQ